MITEQQLAAWEILANKATRGPWLAMVGLEDDPNRCSVVSDGPKNYIIAVIENGQPGDTVATEAATGEFVAATRTAMPDLIAEVRRLRETLSKWGIDPDTGRAIAEESGMRCSLVGTTTQARECIVGMAGWIASRSSSRCTTHPVWR